MTDNNSQSLMKTPPRSPKSPEKKPPVLSERELKDIINKSFSKFNFHFQQLNDKYKIKMEDLSKIGEKKILKFGYMVLDKRIEELDFYVNQYFDEENSQYASPKRP